MVDVNAKNHGLSDARPGKTLGRRIVFISAARQSWGAEQSMFTLAREAVGLGYAVELICFPGTIESDWEEAVGSRAHCIQSQAPLHESKLSENRLLWDAYLRSSQRHDRVVLFTYYLSVATVALRPWFALRGIKTVLDLHDNLPGTKGRALLRVASLGLNNVVACSQYTAEQLNGTTTSVTAIHGPAEPLTPQVAVEGTARRVLIAGRIITEKRHDLVAQAVSSLNDGTVMVVRGSGDGSVHDNSKQVRHDGAALLGERFIDEGKVSPERVLDHTDVLVVANGTEPMGRTVLEAQLSGIPVVVPNAGGSAELVEDGVTGLTFAAGDAQDLARALRVLADDPESAAAMIRQAKSSAEATVTPQHYARKYLAVLAG